MILNCYMILLLCKGNLIFCCNGPTDSNFWQITNIIILTSHANIFLKIFLRGGGLIPQCRLWYSITSKSKSNSLLSSVQPSKCKEKV